MGEHIGVTTRVVAEPVVIVDADVTEHLHFVPHLLRHRSRRHGRHGRVDGREDARVRARVCRGGDEEERWEGEEESAREERRSGEWCAETQHYFYAEICIKKLTNKASKWAEKSGEGHSNSYIF